MSEIELAGKYQLENWTFDQLVAEIAQLRAALEQSVAREAVYWETLDMTLHTNDLEINWLTVKNVLANPNPAVAELLRDRKRLDWLATRDPTWKSYDGKGLREHIDAAIASQEEPSHDR